MRFERSVRCAAVTLAAALFATGANAQNPKCDVRQSQAVLKHLGYNPGPVDGLWGRGTAAAVTRFQTDMEMPSASGTLDVRTCAALEAKRVQAGIAIPKTSPTKRSASVLAWSKMPKCRFLKDRRLNNRLASKGGHVMSLKKGGRIKLATGRVRGGPYDGMGVGTYIRFDAPTRVCNVVFENGGATVVDTGMKLDPGTKYTLE